MAFFQFPKVFLKKKAINIINTAGTIPAINLVGKLIFELMAIKTNITIEE